MTDSEKYREGRGERVLPRRRLKSYWNLKSISSWSFETYRFEVNYNVPFA